MDGFDPVFIDINLKTLGLDTKTIDALEKLKDIRAIFITHAQGQMH